MVTVNSFAHARHIRNKVRSKAHGVHAILHLGNPLTRTILSWYLKKLQILSAQLLPHQLIR